MDDIAGNLTISKRTLYELYSDKEELLIEVINLLFKKRHNQLVNDTRTESDDSMSYLLKTLSVQLHWESQTSPKFLLDMARYPKADKIMVENYKKEHNESIEFMKTAVKEGYFISQYVDYKTTLKIYGTSMRAVKTNEKFSTLNYKDLFYNFLYPFLRGICTEKGVQRVDEYVEKYLFTDQNPE